MSPFHLSWLLGGRAGTEFASLGDFQLENGQDQTSSSGFAQREMNAGQSNAVLFDFLGHGESLDLVGPGKLVDSSKYFVIWWTLWHGFSPPRTAEQPHMRFPQSTSDMVRAEYELATKHLKISHLRAVMGISMGGCRRSSGSSRIRTSWIRRSLSSDHRGSPVTIYCSGRPNSRH